MLKINIPSCFSALLFFPVLLYPPLSFTSKVSDTLRVSLLIALITFLFVRSKKVQSRQLLNLALLFLFAFTQLLLLDFSDWLDVSNALSLILTLLFAISLDTALNNKEIANYLVKFYINLFKLIPVTMLLGLLYFLFWGESDIFNLRIYSKLGDLQYYTPFGILLPKGAILRSTSYFHEPVLISFYLAMNLFIPKGCFYRKQERERFVLLNFIAGVLTFSFLFWITFFVIFCIHGVIYGNWRIKLSIVFILLCVAFLIFQANVLKLSSFSQRLERIGIYLYIFPTLSIDQVLLGVGYNVATGHRLHIASGFFALLYKIGVVGMLTVVTLIWRHSQKNYYLLVACFLSMLSFEPYLYPLFWLAIGAYVAADRMNLSPCNVYRNGK